MTQLCHTPRSQDEQEHTTCAAEYIFVLSVSISHSFAIFAVHLIFWWNRCFICETSQPHFGVPPFASVFWRLNVRSGCVIESPVWLIKANHFDCLNQHVPYISDLLLDSIDVFWVRFWDFASVRSMDFCSRSLVEKITRVAGVSPAKTWNYLEELGFFRNRWEFTHNWGWLVVEATKTDDSNFKAEIF